MHFCWNGMPFDIALEVAADPVEWALYFIVLIPAFPITVLSHLEMVDVDTGSWGFFKEIIVSKRMGSNNICFKHATTSTYSIHICETLRACKQVLVFSIIWEVDLSLSTCMWVRWRTFNSCPPATESKLVSIVTFRVKILIFKPTFGPNCLIYSRTRFTPQVEVYFGFGGLIFKALSITSLISSC